MAGIHDLRHTLTSKEEFTRTIVSLQYYITVILRKLNQEI